MITEKQRNRYIEKNREASRKRGQALTREKKKEYRDAKKEKRKKNSPFTGSAVIGDVFLMTLRKYHIARFGSSPLRFDGKRRSKADNEMAGQQLKKRKEGWASMPDNGMEFEDSAESAAEWIESF